eukprot:TRINITY_DN7699_c0_g1_i2.p1 TRINITY_DN7699_c0_g1~~TRINITY_DN7699_c0_g1_i2.p1  ORF type:complete len:287 (+),score=120.82 TRINITY_DN7699_c0_g1_i2:58-861(+)
MAKLAACAVLALLAAAAPWAYHNAPDQVPSWEGYDRDAGILVFLEVGGIMAAAGLVMHFLWFVLVNKSVRSANAFVQMILSFFFVYNWVALWAYGTPAPLTIGAQSGACAGYEFYGLISEILMFALGEAKRTDMLLHHLSCVVFTGMALYIYSQVTVADLFYWHLVWDSISRTLISNVPFGLRYFSEKTAFLPLANGLFFAIFLWVRWIEQAPIVTKLAMQPVKFDSIMTGVVAAAWVVLNILNLYWGVKIIMIGLGIGKAPKKKTE